MTSKDPGGNHGTSAKAGDAEAPKSVGAKDKVDRGELLDDVDIGFLEEVFAETTNVRPLVAQHPEYQDLAARMMNLYKEITDKALENEKAAH